MTTVLSCLIVVSALFSAALKAVVNAVRYLVRLVFKAFLIGVLLFAAALLYVENKILKSKEGE